MKYQSELIKEIVEKRGHNLSSPHYESECVESWIEEVKGAYPKLCDYESEWLNYINENPLGDFSYETVSVVSEATVDNVVPYAYKRAILSGKTLVNLINVKNATGGIDYTTKDLKLSYELPVGKYILFYDIIKANTSSGLGKPDRHTPIVTFNDDTKIYEGFDGFNTSKGKKYWIIDAQTPIVKVEYWLANLAEDGAVDNLRLFAYQDGMENWDIPYFTGMQSVKTPVLKTTGKNLFNYDSLILNKYQNNEKYNYSIANNTLHAIYKLDVKANTTYSLDIGKTGVFYDINNQPISWFYSNQNPITTPNNCKYIIFNFKDYTTNDYSKAQIEESSTTTEYEPYKSNILTINEDVELSGIDDVKDELNLLTGELTQRIGEIVLDGSEKWNKTMNNASLPDRFVCDNLLNYSSYKEICDSFKTGQSYWSVDATGLYIGTNHKAVISFKSGDERNNYTVAEFKQYLSENPITIQYQLATESVKTVALTPLNKPYKGTNHYHLTTNIPCEAILEVPVVSTGKQTLEEINN